MIWVDGGRWSRLWPDPSEARTDGRPFLHASPTQEAKGDTRPRPPSRWSTGVIMYTLLAGSPPFWHRKQMLMLRMIMDGKYQFGSPEWDDYSDTVKDLVRGHGSPLPRCQGRGACPRVEESPGGITVSVSMMKIPSKNYQGRKGLFWLMLYGYGSGSRGRLMLGLSSLSLFHPGPQPVN